MKKKVIPVLLAIVLIFIIAAVAFGGKIIDKYSYSKERADLTAYFQLQKEDEVAIILQDQLIEEKARIIGGTCYFDLPTVEKYFTDRFYVNKEENVLLFTTDQDVIKILIGDDSNVIYISDIGNSINYKAALYIEDTLYIAADYIRKYVNFSYSLFDAPMHMQVYTEWNVEHRATIKKDTKLRYRGGIKSEILKDLSQEDQVIILEEMETWSKVKTTDAYIGYVENEYLTDKKDAMPTAVTDAMQITYRQVAKEETINLAFHQIFSEQGGADLKKALKNTQAVNVVSPTWFRLKGSQGEFTSIANQSYVQTAHEMGVDVWALLTDVDSLQLYEEEIDYMTLMSSSENRKRLIDGLMHQVETFDLDGINIDLEHVQADAGEHFVQFLRELSIETRRRNVVLSVDNYVPIPERAHYNIKEQGIVADYIVIMGYDWIDYVDGKKQASSNASINFVEGGIQKTKNVVSPEKIINAIPFYTRVWKSSKDGIEDSNLVMSAQDEWVRNTGVEPVWLEEYCQNYVEYERDGKLVQCWLEDEESIRVKLQVMKVQQIAGVAEWKLGIEDTKVWDVIASYVNGEM